MKGCARSALLQLAGFLAILGGIVYFLELRYALAPGKTFGASVFAAVFGWMGLGFLVSIRKPIRERAALAGCMAGKRPADGAWTGIAGTIEPAGELLRSPLTGSECLAYRYSIDLTRGSGRQRTHSVYFEGVALVPSVIATPAGSFRLLAVPEFDFGKEVVEPERALFHWNEHLKTATFETPEAARKTLAKQWTDDDGAYRSEKQHPTAGEVPIEECKFHEDLIRKGDRVYAVGLFSEVRGGIVPHPNWANVTRIMKGDPESILRQLRARIVRYAIGGVVCLGVSAGILAAFLSHAGVL
jgi:hypothetical protein